MTGYDIILMQTKKERISLNFKEDVYYGEYTDEVISLYDPHNDDEAAECWAEVYGATFFDYPHHVYNRLAAQNGIPVYEYYFSKDNGRLGCWHAGELPYVYANLAEKSKLYDEKDYGLMKTFSSYIINFVKNGDPNGTGLPRFEVNEDSVSYLELGETVTPIKEKQRKIELFRILDKING